MKNMRPEQKADWLIDKHEYVYEQYSIAVDHAIVTVETILTLCPTNTPYWIEVKNYLKQL
jgi:hypothetical protein